MARLLSTISDRMISHHEMSRKAAFARFLSEPGAVWISPSSTRGLDLPYDACEWVIWLKAPYLNLNDPLVNARLYGGGRLGKLWYAGDAVQNIIQGAGRGFRSEDDYCTVYLFDEQIGRLLKDHTAMFPLWFRELISWE